MTGRRIGISSSKLSFWSSNEAFNEFERSRGLWEVLSCLTGGVIGGVRKWDFAGVHGKRKWGDEFEAINELVCMRLNESEFV